MHADPDLALADDTATDNTGRGRTPYPDDTEMGEFFSHNGDAGQQEYDSDMPDSETDLGNDG